MPQSFAKKKSPLSSTTVEVLAASSGEATLDSTVKSELFRTRKSALLHIRRIQKIMSTRHFRDAFRALRSGLRRLTPVRVMSLLGERVVE
jgi:hypothetical protein